jgi:hypothetical protein
VVEQEELELRLQIYAHHLLHLAVLADLQILAGAELVAEQVVLSTETVEMGEIMGRHLKKVLAAVGEGAMVLVMEVAEEGAVILAGTGLVVEVEAEVVLVEAVMLNQPQAVMGVLVIFLVAQGQLAVLHPIQLQCQDQTEEQRQLF